MRGRGEWRKVQSRSSDTTPRVATSQRAKMSDIDLDELRSELEEFAPLERKVGRSAREERIIAGFEDIQRFFEKHGRVPQHGEDRDIFERLYAVRLERLGALNDCRALLLALDHQGLLKIDPNAGEQ